MDIDEAKRWIGGQLIMFVLMPFLFLSLSCACCFGGPTLRSWGVLGSPLLFGEDAHRDRLTLVSGGVFQRDEVVEVLYSAGWSVRDEGSALTDTRVVTWWENEDTHLIESYGTLYADIQDIDVRDRFLSNGKTVSVYPAKGPSYEMVIDPSGVGPDPFIDALMERWAAHRRGVRGPAD
jgi:hypothetical protein